MKRRIVNVIKETIKGSLDGSLSFSEVVGRLITIGVSHYRVDFLRSEQVTYLSTGESHVSKLPPSAEPIAPSFSAPQVAAAVKASQTEGQSFPDFVTRARSAGCIGYVEYLEGARVIYTGRLGDEHIEVFP